MNYFWHFQHDDFYWVLHQVAFDRKNQIIPKTDREKVEQYMDRWLPAVSLHFSIHANKRGNRTISESITYGICQWFHDYRQRLCPDIVPNVFDNEPNIDEWRFVMEQNCINNNDVNTKTLALNGQKARMKRLKMCNLLIRDYKS